MKLNSLVPMLWTNDLVATIAFYRDLLGFECVNRVEGWACLHKDEVELRLSLPNAHEPFDRIQFPGSLSFHPDNVEELWQHLKGKATNLSSIRSKISTTACASSPFATTTATSCNLHKRSDSPPWPLRRPGAVIIQT